MTRPPRAWFARPAPVLARALIGQRLVRVLDDGVRLAGTIVETEAYLGVKDRAAHTFGGRRTARNEAMYARPGTAYVYFTYGMHHCVNVVCGKINEPIAVLIRALEPTEGLDRMYEARTRAQRDRDLCSGPAKLTEALAVDRTLNGVDLATDRQLFVEILRTMPIDTMQLVNTPRIGVDGAGDWAQRPLRWALVRSEHVSGPRARGGPSRSAPR